MTTATISNADENGTLVKCKRVLRFITRVRQVDAVVATTQTRSLSITLRCVRHGKRVESKRSERIGMT